MEKLKDETRTLFKKIDVCPRCQNHLEADLKRRQIQCPKCGLIIEIDSKYNNTKRWSIVGFGYAIGFAMLWIGSLFF